MVRGPFFSLILANVRCAASLSSIICKCPMIGILPLGTGGRFSFFPFVKNITDAASASITTATGTSPPLNPIFLLSPKLQKIEQLGILPLEISKCGSISSSALCCRRNLSSENTHSSKPKPPLYIPVLWHVWAHANDTDDCFFLYSVAVWWVGSVAVSVEYPVCRPQPNNPLYSQSADATVSENGYSQRPN